MGPFRFTINLARLDTNIGYWPTGVPTMQKLEPRENHMLGCNKYAWPVLQKWKLKWPTTLCDCANEQVNDAIKSWCRFIHMKRSNLYRGSTCCRQRKHPRKSHLLGALISRRPLDFCSDKPCPAVTSFEGFELDYESCVNPPMVPPIPPITTCHRR